MRDYITKEKNSIQGNSEGETKVVRFTVFGKPVPKARARTVTEIDGNGKKKTHSFTPEKTAIQEQKIALVYKSVYHGFKFPKGVPLALFADFFFPIPARAKKSDKEAMKAGEIRPTMKPDTDNLTKTVADSANGVIYEDDSQVVEMHARKFYSEQPRTEITFFVIDEVESDG